MWMNLTQSFWLAADAKSKSSGLAFSTIQPYLIIIGVAITMTVGSVLIWKSTFDLEDKTQQKDARLWGLVLSFIGVLLAVTGFFWYLILGNQLTTRISILEGVGLGLFMGMYAVGTFSFSRSSALKSTFFGGVSLLSMVAALIAIGALNYYANNVAKKYDFTKNKLETLSTKSTKVLKNLRKEVKLIGFFYKREQRYEAAARAFFEKFRDVNRKKFSFRFVDPMEYPELVSCYKPRGGRNYANRLILANGKCEKTASKKGKKGLALPNQMTFKGQKIVLEKFPPTEKDVVNKLLRVSRKSKKVCFTTGHNQPSIKQQGPNNYFSMKAILKDMNYENREINIASDGIPKECDVLVHATADVRSMRGQPPIAAKLTANEVDTIKDYLAKGGRMMVMQEALIPSGLEELLKDTYGVKTGSGLLLDFVSNAANVTRRSRESVTSPVITQSFTNHPITKGFRGKAVTVLSYASFVEPGKIPSGVKVRKLLSTDKPRLRGMMKPRSWAYYFPNPNTQAFAKLLRTTRLLKTGKMVQQVAMGLIEQKFPKARKGPLSMGVAVTKKLKKSNKETRLVVFGDGSIADETRLVYNKTLVTNSIAWLAEEDELIDIPTKKRKSSTIRLTSTQRNFMRYTTRFGMPLFFLLMILFISAYRRMQ